MFEIIELIIIILNELEWHEPGRLCKRNEKRNKLFKCFDEKGS